ncbi:hypothetical protein [Pseudogulbenkiania ferrooxidans]|uniref:hypothetical protein n=1 Tax=Pseudogulbenkiania ferrooxidans TaxID=549169 RepID=UPI0003F54D25|nr:hypothetical protein [Pseudogulbenkiania ferrooxidans]
MTISTLSNLKENLVPFRAFKARSTIAWCNESNDEQAKIIAECSYLIDTEENESDSKIFYAERYGGSGISYHGGGARCGFDGKYHIKGIGPNPLLGRDVDRFHSSGSLSFEDAIYETLWGEILHRALPCGAVRSRAILLTDKVFKNNFGHDEKTARRALLVRSPEIRPAHFERAIFFRKQYIYNNLIGSDIDRVKSVIKIFPSTITGKTIDSAGNVEDIYMNRLLDLATSLAHQMSYCRANYLMLSTSPSNVTVSGKLMDFNGVFSLWPSYTNKHSEHQLRLKSFIDEPSVILEGIKNIAFYASKYLFDRDFFNTATVLIANRFNHEFELRWIVEKMSFLGVFFDTKNHEVILKFREISHIIDIIHRRSYFTNPTPRNDSLRKILGIISQQILQDDDSNLASISHCIVDEGLALALISTLVATKPIVRQYVEEGEIKVKGREMAYLNMCAIDRSDFSKKEIMKEIYELTQVEFKSPLEVQEALKYYLQQKTTAAKNVFRKASF